MGRNRWIDARVMALGVKWCLRRARSRFLIALVRVLQKLRADWLVGGFTGRAFGFHSSLSRSLLRGS
jgi:hypothetical protein